MKFFSLLLFLVFTVSASAQDDSSADSTASSQPASTTPNTVNVEDVADDSQIKKRLQDIFESSERFEEISVASKDGFVTLNGLAETDESKEWASKITSRTKDVIGVNNLIEVQSSLNFADSMTVVWNSLDRLYRDFLIRLPFIIAGLFVLLLTWISARSISWVVRKLLNGRKFRSSLKDLIKQLTSISVWIIGFLLATVVVFPGMTPSKALTVLGLGSVAIGFAFKDIFENFFAGVLILWRYPIEKGDFIQHGDILGKVEEITIRNTMIRRPDGELVVVPNGQLFKSNVEVLTNRPKRRVRITCGVGYGENVDKSREVIRDAVANCDSINGPKAVEVFAKQFGSSSIDFEVAWWTGAKPTEVRQSRDEVIAAIKSALDDAGIEIPFPYRTLTFAEDLRIKGANKTSISPATGWATANPADPSNN